MSKVCEGRLNKRGLGLVKSPDFRYISAVMARKRTGKRKSGKAKKDPDASKGVSKEFIEFNGVVEECLPAATFRIRLENGQIILGHLSGRMRRFRIRLLPGDEVKVEMTPYDLTKGRVVYRY